MMDSGQFDDAEDDEMQAPARQPAHVVPARLPVQAAAPQYSVASANDKLREREKIILERRAVAQRLALAEAEAEALRLASYPLGTVPTTLGHPLAHSSYLLQRQAALQRAAAPFGATLPVATHDPRLARDLATANLGLSVMRPRLTSVLARSPFHQAVDPSAGVVPTIQNSKLLDSSENSNTAASPRARPLQPPRAILKAPPQHLAEIIDRDVATGTAAVEVQGVPTVNIQYHAPPTTDSLIGSKRKLLSFGKANRPSLNGHVTEAVPVASVLQASPVECVTRWITHELQHGSWPSPSWDMLDSPDSAKTNDRMMRQQKKLLASFLEDFSKKVLVPSFQAPKTSTTTSDQTEPSDVKESPIVDLTSDPPKLPKGCYATLLAMREVLIQNSERIFGSKTFEIACEGAVDTKSAKEEAAELAKILATGVVLAGIERGLFRESTAQEAMIQKVLSLTRSLDSDPTLDETESDAEDEDASTDAVATNRTNGREASQFTNGLNLNLQEDVIRKICYHMGLSPPKRANHMEISSPKRAKKSTNSEVPLTTPISPPEVETSKNRKKSNRKQPYPRKSVKKSSRNTTSSPETSTIPISPAPQETSTTPVAPEPRPAPAVRGSRSRRRLPIRKKQRSGK